ncbi:MAG: ThiJ/PfpI [Rhodospirillaceae bacterium]|nr:MAG: ThiJ/PfpI [Rhodospirillaceae bacterium]
MKKFAVVLSGCGVFDGAEIHEAVLTLLAIDRQGGSSQCFAPDMPQAHVINHLTGQEMPETRNVLVESARIARGAIKNLRDYKAAEYDGLIFPGGFGAAKNLSSVAFDGAACKVTVEVERAIRETRAADKPIGALCISPTLHQNKGHGEVCIDATAKVVTTPCYMLDSTIGQIATGAENVVAAMMRL